MASAKDLHTRLAALEEKLTNARQKIEFKRGLNDGHNLTSGELMARHAFLVDALSQEVAEFETHDRHVTALEQDAITWINSIDLTES
jgi:hypothetical protein